MPTRTFITRAGLKKMIEALTTQNQEQRNALEHLLARMEQMNTDSESITPSDLRIYLAPMIGLIKSTLTSTDDSSE